MPVKVLLKGFSPDIPEDQLVTFINDLPDCVLCIQCTNVSSKLYRDKKGHGYCHGCKLMCTTENLFDCSTCDHKFTVQELVVDDTIPAKLAKEKVICPRSAKSDDIEICFSALKAHLKGCCCENGSSALYPGQQCEGPQSKAINSQGPAQPSSLPNDIEYLHATVCTLKEDIKSLKETVRQKDTDIERLKNNLFALQENAKVLNERITQRDTDIDHLNATVIALQEDIKNVRIRCETRIATSESNISDVKDHCAYLQDVVGVFDGERKKIHDMVEKMQQNYEKRLVDMRDRIKDIEVQLLEVKNGWQKVEGRGRQKPRGGFV